MKHLKDRDYVRVIDYTSTKIVRALKVCDDGFHADNNMYYLFSEVIKSNHDIKNLIEIGDYVNGAKLLSIDYAEDEDGNCDKSRFYYSFEDSDKDVNEYYDELRIETILTKEQFENNCYKIGE